MAGNRPSASRKRTRRPSLAESRRVYYERLVYQCRKELHQQIKRTKTFILQKHIRRLKQQNDDQESVVTATAQPQVQQLEQWKECDLTPIVDECFRRLGILQLDPALLATTTTTTESDVPVEQEEINASHEPVADNDTSVVDVPTKHDSVNDDKAPTTAPRTPEWILRRILQHKKMRDTLEHWNDQVTEYRRWNMRRQDWQQGRVSDAARPLKKSKQPQSQKQAALDAKGLSGSLFCRLGEDPDNADEDGSGNGPRDGHYGPASLEEPRKKNRRGQRARKAKALAVEARQQGRTLDRSINWRPKKMDPNDHQGPETSIPSRSRPGHQSQHSQPTPTPDDTAHLHPSWEARKAQKSGIVSFQGTKITFD
jgi:hypothetical protein